MRHFRFPERMAAALRGRDWFGVFIEFGAVVFGVLLALQANQWAEQRKIASERSALAERLVADLRTYADKEDKVAEARAKRVANIIWLVDTLQSGDVRQVDRARLATAVDNAISFDDAQPLPMSFENLIASQALDRLDPDVRVKLEDVARYHAKQEMGIKLFHDHVIDHFDLAERALPVRTKDFVDEGWRITKPDNVDVDVLTDPEFLIMARESLRRDGMMRYFDAQLADLARSAASALEQRDTD